MGDFHDDNDDEEDEVAVGKISYWHLTVHVHGKAINISCGDATQRLKWLAHVGIGKVCPTYPSSVSCFSPKRFPLTIYCISSMGCRKLSRMEEVGHANEGARKEERRRGAGYGNDYTRGFTKRGSYFCRDLAGTIRHQLNLGAV